MGGIGITHATDKGTRNRAMREWDSGKRRQPTISSCRKTAGRSMWAHRCEGRCFPRPYPNASLTCRQNVFGRDFHVPMFVHDTIPPDVPVLKQLHDEIHYATNRGIQAERSRLKRPIRRRWTLPTTSYGFRSRSTRQETRWKSQTLRGSRRLITDKASTHRRRSSIIVRVNESKAPYTRPRQQSSAQSALETGTAAAMRRVQPSAPKADVSSHEL
jgi:hypothetical protein